MSWMNKLCQTYDNNLDKAGDTQSDKPPLSVISHMPAKAQLEVVIDQNGNLIELRKVEKDNCSTIIPVTESSGGRAGSKIAPHPLSDTLSYIAKDYSVFAKTEKEQKSAEKRFLAYITQLRNWVESEYTHPKIQAVYTYLEKGTLMSDLIRAEIVKTDEIGKLTADKINGQEYEKCIARFRVMSSDDDSTSACWEDAELFKSFAEFYISSQPGTQDVCYISGKSATVCTNHPKGIVQANYGAKLVSANDNSGFTFKGRFENSDQACTISYEATQKAHNALSWLAKIQGMSVGTTDKRTYVCWCPEGKPVINVLSKDMFFFDESTCNTHEELKKSMFNLFSGRKAEFDVSDDVVLIALDAATTGRLSVTYYNELKACDFLDRMENWGETCNWYYKTKLLDGKYADKVKTPETRRLVEYAFGTEQGEFIGVSDKILKEQTQRIVHCMADKQPIPRDIVHALAIKASNPQSYKKWWNYENVLSTACAVITKFYNDLYKNLNKEVIFTMDADVKIEDRSYLFGRLLGLLRYAETKAMNYKYAKTGQSDNRPTNAEKFMSAYLNHPTHTLSIIQRNLRAYTNRDYTRADRTNLEKDISDILAKIQQNNGFNNLPLGDLFILGYSTEFKYLSSNGFRNNNKN